VAGKGDPARLLEQLAQQRDVRAHELRHLRAEALHALLLQLHGLVATTGFADALTVRGDGIYVDVGGVLLDTLTNRAYLKGSGAPQVNIGAEMNRALVAFGITPSTIVDVGANYGEAALWFARAYPQACIIAIEPSSSNRKVLEKNRGAQAFPTGNLEIWPEAVLDRAGKIRITTGLGTMNHVREPGLAQTEEVVAERLESLLDQRGITSADFVKVDIEGAEPKLEGSLVALGDRVRCYLIEFSSFAPLEEYLSLADALMRAGFRCFDAEGKERLECRTAVRKHVQPLLAAEGVVTNLWFVR
jgi:FkbM family methyltransferase